jgi:hypothetical protein
MINAAPHHETERVEADFLHQQEFVHREVAREELMLPHLLEPLTRVLREVLSLLTMVGVLRRARHRPNVSGPFFSATTLF